VIDRMCRVVLTRMPEYCSTTDVPEAGARRGLGSTCDRLLSTLALLAVVSAGDALAGEEGATKTHSSELRPFGSFAAPLSAPSLTVPSFAASSLTEPAVPSFADPSLFGRSLSAPILSEPLYPAALLSAPSTYPLPQLPDTKTFSSTEFRPRGRSVLEDDLHLGVEDGLMHDTDLWQQLAEYRNRDRVRLLTLWNSGLGTVSLQAGHKGDPSLQWTSHLMSRGATHGLLDRWLPVSRLSDGGSHAVTHGAASSPGKTANLLGAAHAVSSATP